MHLPVLNLYYVFQFYHGKIRTLRFYSDIGRAHFFTVVNFFNGNTPLISKKNIKLQYLITRL